MVSRQPRKQRKTLYSLPVHAKRQQVRAHLDEPLLLKYDLRTVTLRKGDTVRILRGDYAGTTGKVLEIDSSGFTVTVEGVTTETAKHMKKPRPIHPSNVVITKLDLTDKLRRAALGASEADVEPAEKPAKAEEKAPEREKAEAVEEEEDEEKSAPSAPRGSRDKTKTEKEE